MVLMRYINKVYTYDAEDNNINKNIFIKNVIKIEEETAEKFEHNMTQNEAGLIDELKSIAGK